MRKFNNYLVTGGCGFIGTNFIRSVIWKLPDNARIINLDKLTYAGNKNNLTDIAAENAEKYVFIQGDICDFPTVKKIMESYHVDCIIHFAAESHVDRSIYGPKDFIDTNIIGTFNLLEAARELWKDRKDVLFHHVSTDEVFGSLGETGAFTETTPYAPRSPYSASKAASDHLVNAYFHTYNIPITLSNCSNNYGPYQFPEKLIPLMITNMLEEKQLPIYGDGMNIRDWLYVEDHTEAICEIVQSGNMGETYNIGGETELTNIDTVNILCEKMAEKMNKSMDYYKRLITYVKDRPGHDRRYAIDCTKMKNELGWKQKYTFDRGISNTIDWYLNNTAWIENIRSGEYQNWVEKHYQ